jgi:hypothetical protein
MQYAEFLETYCRWVPAGNGKSQLSLKEKHNYDCVFWGSGGESRSNRTEAAGSKHGGGCMVYEARPLQCRTFPFWASIMNSKATWKMAALDCPGMDQGMFQSQDSIKKMLAIRQMEPIIFKST